MELAQYDVQWVDFCVSDVEHLGQLLVALFPLYLFFWRSVFVGLEFITKLFADAAGNAQRNTRGNSYG
jgi:hypothetical protein